MGAAYMVGSPLTTDATRQEEEMEFALYIGRLNPPLLNVTLHRALPALGSQ